MRKAKLVVAEESVRPGSRHESWGTPLKEGSSYKKHCRHRKPFKGESGGAQKEVFPDTEETETSGEGAS